MNEVKPADPFQYVPEVRVRNLKWMDHLRDSRLPALAGWNKDFNGIFDVLNDVTKRIFAQFSTNGTPAKPDGGMRFGEEATASAGARCITPPAGLRMPYRATHNGAFQQHSVVDEDLRVVGTQHLYLCDMSVMPRRARAAVVAALRVGYSPVMLRTETP